MRWRDSLWRDLIRSILLFIGHTSIIRVLIDRRSGACPPITSIRSSSINALSVSRRSRATCSRCHAESCRVALPLSFHGGFSLLGNGSCTGSPSCCTRTSTCTCRSGVLVVRRLVRAASGVAFAVSVCAGSSTVSSCTRSRTSHSGRYAIATLVTTIRRVSAIIPSIGHLHRSVRVWVIVGLLGRTIWERIDSRGGSSRTSSGSHSTDVGYRRSEEIDRVRDRVSVSRVKLERQHTELLIRRFSTYRLLVKCDVSLSLLSETKEPQQGAEQGKSRQSTDDSTDNGTYIGG